MEEIVNKEKRKASLEDLKPKYIYSLIFNFIKDKYFKFKLFKHSKLFQKLLDINLSDYEKINVILSNINFPKYFYDEEYLNENFPKAMRKNLNMDLLYNGFTKSTIQNYIRYYYKNNSQSDRQLIAFESPFYDFISKEDFFEDNFTLLISTNYIEDEKSLEKYKSKISELKVNNLFLKFCFEDKDDVDFFTQLEIDTNIIRSLNIEYFSRDRKKLDVDSFFVTLFSFQFKNLIYLDIRNINVKSENFEKINNLRLLEALILSNIEFINTFVLKLYNIKSLELDDCENITFDENNQFNLETLIIKNCDIMAPKSKIKFPLLEDLDLYKVDFQNAKKIKKSRYKKDPFSKNYGQDDNKIEIEYDNILIDFKSAKKIKKIRYKNNSILKYFDKDSLIEEINLYDIAGALEYNYFEKFIQFKFLKILTLNIDGYLDIISFKEIPNFVIPQVEKLNIFWENFGYNCKLNNLQKLFPNLSEIKIKAKYNDPHSSSGIIRQITNLEINEEPDCKINKFEISGTNRCIQFYCQSFENLIDISINTLGIEYNTKECFPIFNNDCNVIFKSLTNFNWEYDNRGFKGKEHSDIFKNVCNNFDKMPNLKKMNIDFTYLCNFDGDYELFIKKVLYKLEQARISIGGKGFLSGNYSDEEMMKINPNLDYYKLKKFKITKIKKK